MISGGHDDHVSSDATYASVAGKVLDDVEHARHLRKDEHAMAFATQLGQQLGAGRANSHKKKVLVSERIETRPSRATLSRKTNLPEHCTSRVITCTASSCTE